MLPSELKLTSLGHCYVHLPETFVSQDKAIKGGAIVSIKSLQTENELFVMWNGQLTSGEHVQLDLNFAQANNLKDELVIISPAENLSISECTFCRVEVLKASEYSILSQHTETNLLDTCKLISKNLVVPIFVSQHVHVLVRILSFEPSQPFGMLTKWTEMSFEHGLVENSDQKCKDIIENVTVSDPITLISCALGIDYNPKFYLGSVLICGQRGSGKTYLLKNLLNDYKPNYSELLDCKQFRGKRPEVVKKRLQELLNEAIEKQPSMIALDNVDSILNSDPHKEEELGQEMLYNKRLVDTFCYCLKQLERQEGRTTNSVVLIATCRSIDTLDERISNPIGRKFFNEIITLKTPSLQDRATIIKNIITQQRVCYSIDDIQFQEIAQRCASYMPSDLKRIFERSLINACSRLNLEFSSEPMIIQSSDFTNAIDGYVPMNLRAISLQPKTMRTLESVGGMKKIKDELTKAILLPIKYPKLYKKCPLKLQKSALLYGPPGCGKTLIAEALINQDGINSICIRGPELLSKYIGASEAAVRDLFHRAHMAQPCVIFFDEFESLVAKRGTDSTGVTDRVVNQFLTILDGVESLGHNVFIIAASSRPDMIDPAMLRPGRLDRHIYCPLPDELDRIEMLKVLSKDMNFIDGPNSISAWSNKLEGFTGADIQAFLYSAQLKALHEMIDPAASSDDLDANVSLASTAHTPHPTASKVRANLRINVSQKHLVESYNDMKQDVEARLANLIKKYPPSIGRQSGGRIATRATLV